jgi:hypothetical protein
MRASVVSLTIRRLTLQDSRVHRLASRLGCEKKEFRCRPRARQPEAISRHQSPVTSEV